MNLEYKYTSDGWEVAKNPMDCLIDTEDNRALISEIESRLATHENAFFGDSDNCPLTHSFASGMYVREIFLPAGVIVVGKIHKHDHPNFLMKGKVSVFTESGGVEVITAPKSMISPAGTKRVVYAHEDTVWVTVHKTDSQDLAEIEEETIAKTYEEVQLCLG